MRPQHSHLNDKEAAGTVLALLAAAISGFSIFANKVFIVDLDPAVFTALRSLAIGLVFFLVVIFTGKGSGKPLRGMDWRYLAAIGVIGGGLAFLSFFTGLKFTTAGRAAFLHKLLPFFVAILAFVFLKERISRKQAAGLGVMLLGALGIYFANIPISELWASPSFGDALVIFAAALWGVENVLAKKAMNAKESNWAVSFGRMFIGGVFLFASIVFMGKTGAVLAINPAQAVNILASTIILFGYVLFYYWSIRHINVSKAAGLLLLAPVVTLVLGMVFLKEPASMVQIVGSAAILIGSCTLLKAKSENRHKDRSGFTETI